LENSMISNLDQQVDQEKYSQNFDRIFTDRKQLVNLRRNLIGATKEIDKILDSQKLDTKE